jgi:hypothetical protein
VEPLPRPPHGRLSGSGSRSRRSVGPRRS